MVRWALAQLGVAVFAIALIVPTSIYYVSYVSRPATVLVASSSELNAAASADVTLPNETAEGRRRMVSDSQAEQLAAEPTNAPPNVAVVTASWYGSGFYENRLPCWQWLRASGLPIQLMPDTWGVAHKTLPCGTMLTLTHGANTITVPVVDRGPYIAGRELDLAARVKAALGCGDLCTVVMQIP